MEYKRVFDKKLVLSVVATGLMSFCGVIVETAMNVTFPTLMKEFSIGTSMVQWCTTGYLLVLSVVITLSSFLKKRFRTKQQFTAAVVLFIIGTVLCILSPAFWFLLAGRMIQGVATGIALPLMMNIILEQAPLEKTGMLMGIAMMISSLAPALGPALGGIMVDTIGWRGVFWVLLPVLVLALVLGIFSIRQGWDTEKISFNVIEWIILAGCFTCLILGTSNVSEWGMTSPAILGLFAGFVVLGFIYAFHSKHSGQPLLNLHVLRYRPYFFSCIAVATQQICLLGAGYLIPNFSQISWGVSSTVAGLALIPGCLIAAVLSPFGGSLLDRIGAKKPVLGGAAISVVGFIIVCFIAPYTHRMFWFVIGYAIVFFGLSFTTGNNMTNGLRQVPDACVADGNAINNTVQQLAGAIGTAVCSTIVAAAQAAGPADYATATAIGSYRAFAVVFAFEIVTVAAFIMVFAAIGKRQNKTAGKEIAEGLKK